MTTTELTVDERYVRMIERTARINHSLRRMHLELTQDEKQMRPCACRRQWTRLGICLICAAEELEKQRMVK